MSKAGTGKRVLVADDDSVIRRLLKFTLEREGFEPVFAADGAEAMELADDDTLAALLDLKMPRADGLEVLRFLKQRYPHVPVVMISAVNQVREAVVAMKEGALEFITKPFDLEHLVSLLEQAVKMGRIAQENAQLRSSVGFSAPGAEGFVGESPQGRRLVELAKKVAPLDTTVLIPGESGVGKTLLARMIHSAGPRAEAPFVTVSCPTLPRDLLESELFGHEKGAFTGALRQRTGRAEIADGGTLFLDEVGDLPLDLQPKLLNFLQDHSFQRVGGNREIHVDVRLVAATNLDLAAMVERREFREDLYYRLNVIPIPVPPLRERPADIAPLCLHILGRIAAGRGDPPCTIEDRAGALLAAYPWPGNVRQLENVLERASAFCTDFVIRTADLPPDIASGKGPAPADAAAPTPATAAPADGQPNLAGYTLEELERLALAQTLAACDNNKSEAARRLGISQKTIYNKLRRFDMSTGETATPFG